MRVALANARPLSAFGKKVPDECFIDNFGLINFPNIYTSI
jgi:hypothetical protein